MNMERIKQLQTDHQIVIPQGIVYSEFPKQYWPQLEAFERAIYPFMVVQARIKGIPKPPANLDIDEATYYAQAGRVPRTPHLEAIIVDSKTFHLTLGGEWDLSMDKYEGEMTPEGWANMAKGELIDGYRKHYKLK